MRVILEKPTSQKVFDALWTGAKIVLAFLVFSALLGSSREFTSENGLQKNYFDGYFGSTNKNPAAAEVAVISLFGEISDAPSALANLSEGVVADDAIFLLHTAAEDPEVHAILLRIDSPGGTVLAAEKITALIQEIQQKKPVFALFEGSATSGAYYIASVTKKIFTYESTLTGNIGVIIFLPKIADLLEKIGVEVRTLTSGDLKDMGSLFRDLKPEEREIFTALIQESYERFLKTVAQGRKMDVEKLRPLADGRVYSGAQAVRNGLADETVSSFAETLEKIAAELKVSQVQAVSFDVPLSSWEQFLLQLQGKFENLGLENKLSGAVENKNLRMMAQ